MPARRLGPEFRARARFDVAERIDAVPYGGLAAIHRLAQEVGLVDRIDAALELFKVHHPYWESDHVLNIAFNALCGARVLDDIEVRRNDVAFLDMLGARMIPDPTTAGDFCRRFDEDSIHRLMDAINDVRVEGWRQQPQEFFEETARIDADGTLVPTTGECKEGMDVSHKGGWGYHPLLVSLANTGEPLFIVNRSGNRPSHEGAAEVYDQAIELCRRAGFGDILLRGDTDFSLTRNFDRWDDDGVRFVFGYDAKPNLVDKAREIEESDYAELLRRADEAFKPKRRRAKQPRVKQAIVEERGYRNLVLEREDLAEFDYQPRRTRRPYRIIVLRKSILEEKGQVCLGHCERYFFYVTNDRSLTPEQVVREANHRCNQENLIEQLKNGPRALHAPVNTLMANWAYMVIASLAWTLKAWFALMLPVTGRWRARHQAERQRVLRMEFRTFVQYLMLIPVQIVRAGRRLILRILSWRPGVPTLFRLTEALGA
jgi:hypothetical protein